MEGGGARGVPWEGPIFGGVTRSGCSLPHRALGGAGDVPRGGFLADGGSASPRANGPAGFVGAPCAVLAPLLGVRAERDRRTHIGKSNATFLDVGR